MTAILPRETPPRIYTARPIPIPIHTRERADICTDTDTDIDTDADTHTHTHTHYVKETKKPEPTVDSGQTGHLSKQLVGPKKKKVSSRLGAFLRDSKNGDGSVLPPLQSHISPLVVLLPLALRREGSCIPCSIAYMLLVQSSSATSTTAGPQPQTDTIPRQTSSMGPYPHPSAGLHATTAAHNVQHTGKRNAEIDWWHIPNTKHVGDS